ncbi:Uma2 family endonuclease [Gloeobacter violaceus]|uniref:Gll2410 protein n=1 Tax=Gloeobacter violaceus (strain ATCC 29082 / PCC 7421) TaxID=251221 RepID=Q7NHX5_GLOVI|nr:Uma2 family endonuclease [Gloeobacter violaceus]BAC90351.1 gll2410 [Gloeobacter violaceus PCC 7421]
MVLSLHLKPVLMLDDDQFFELCGINRDLRLERTAQGELIIMAPAGGDSGRRCANFLIELGFWHRRNNLGIVFDSSTGFKLPNGADRSPDAAWVKLERWQALSESQRRKFPPLAPDFVTEIRFPSDALKTLQTKMQEYVDCGVQLGFLIDPETQRVEIYRPGRDAEVLQSPQVLDGEDVLPGARLNLQDVLF